MLYCRSKRPYTDIVTINNVVNNDLYVLCHTELGTESGLPHIGWGLLSTLERRYAHGKPERDHTHAVGLPHEHQFGRTSTTEQQITLCFFCNHVFTIEYDTSNLLTVHPVIQDSISPTLSKPHHLLEITRSRSRTLWLDPLFLFPGHYRSRVEVTVI
jgi:hypothetical protein